MNRFIREGVCPALATTRKCGHIYPGLRAQIGVSPGRSFDLRCSVSTSDEGRRNTVFITELRQIANYYMGGKTMSDENVGMSGLTASEASEFMRSYEKGMWTFVAIASAAHIAVWKWQPWFGM